MAVKLTHNFDGGKFMWLYAKYATGCNPIHHCTNAIQGKYSKRFSRLNPDFTAGQTIEMDEFPNLNWDAIYICGVSKQGYTKHKNYPHNVHVAIIPEAGVSDHWEFENWKIDVSDGMFERVPSEKEIDPKYLNLPEEYWTCRMYRWAVWHFRNELANTQCHVAIQIMRDEGYNYARRCCENLEEMRENYKADLKDEEKFSEEGFIASIRENLMDGDFFIHGINGAFTDEMCYIAHELLDYETSFNAFLKGNADYIKERFHQDK